MVHQTQEKATIRSEVDRNTLERALGQLWDARESIESIRRASDPLNHAEAVRARRLEFLDNLLQPIIGELRAIRAGMPVWDQKKVE